MKLWEPSTARSTLVGGAGAALAVVAWWIAAGMTSPNIGGVMALIAGLLVGGGVRLGAGRHGGPIVRLLAGGLTLLTVLIASFIVAADWRIRLGWRITMVDTLVGVHGEGLLAVVPLVVAGIVLAIVISHRLVERHDSRTAQASK